MKILGTLFLLLFVIFNDPSVLAETPTEKAERHATRGNVLVMEGRLFHAVKEYRHALAAGMNDADLYRNLSLALYDLRLVDESIEAMEKAVSQAKEKDLTHMELGILYMVKDQLDRAAEHLLKALEINPGLTDAYYYLGELLLRRKEYRLSWFAAETAKKLGHPGEELHGKLTEKLEKPDIFPWERAGDKLFIRQILVDTKEEAESLVQRIKDGEYFEDIADDEYGRPDKYHKGGIVGAFHPDDLNENIRAILLGNDVFSGPHVIGWKDAFLVVQRIMPMDLEAWNNFHQEIPSVETSTERREEEIPWGIVVTEKIDKNKTRVYVASYPSERFAAPMVEKLKEVGFPAYILVDEGRDGKKLYNAMAGEYNERRDAYDVRSKLKSLGYKAFLSAK